MFAKIYDKHNKKGEGNNHVELPPPSESLGNTGGSKKQKKRKRTQSSSTSQPKQAFNKRSKSLPSEQAIALSSQLKLLSNQKKLQEAIELYYHESNDGIRDEVHACIVIDCCARCGDISKGEDIVKKLKEEQGITDINVQTKTALLKGYVHSGMIKEASLLYKEMLKSKGGPNVRTLNTFLRGCLWSAATLFLDEDRNSFNGVNYEIFGGVISSEDIWPHRVHNLVPDLSSYEYSITLLTQALRISEAESRIQLLEKNFGFNSKKSSDEGLHFYADDPFSLETLAVSYISLARAFALMNQKSRAETCASKVLSITSSIDAVTNNNENNKKCSMKNSGGKRSWKSERKHDTDDNDPESDQKQSRREISNKLFRQHKIHEIQSEANTILNICKNKNIGTIDLPFFITTRLLYFNGGGTTDQSATLLPITKHSSDDCNQLYLLNSLWNSFGLASAIKKAYPNSNLPFSKKVLNEKDCVRIIEVLGFHRMNILNSNGFIDFACVFSKKHDGKITLPNEPNRPLYLELGSGFGEWAVYQAQHNRSCDYVAVELRADRVHQMFTKAMLNSKGKPLENLCCIGSECGSLIHQRIINGSISKIFINHPEPPTQTYGSDVEMLNTISRGGEEPAHMLNSATIFSAIRCLNETNGELIIVTDNRWYGKLLCSTLLKVMLKCNEEQSGLSFYNKKFSEQSGIYQVEIFHEQRSSSKRTKEKIILYEGKPNEAIGHFTAENEKNQTGSSYFDRLWRSGAGTHAEVEKRFIICITRYPPLEYTKRHVERTQSKKPKNKKRNAEKQKARNERRLIKKQLLQEDGKVN